MIPFRPGRSVLAALVLGMCSAALAHGGTTYYVDTNNPAANDHNPGTQALPFKTLQHAAKQLDYTYTGGNTILVEPGTYYEKVTFFSHGAPGDTNVVRADGPGVVIDGARPIPPEWWTQGSGTTWYFIGSVGAMLMDGQNLPYTSAPPESMPAPSWHQGGMMAGVPVYVNLGGDDPRTHDMLYGAFAVSGFVAYQAVYLRVEGFEIRNWGGHGIFVYGGAHVEFRNNYVHHTGVDGVDVYGQYLSDIHINGNHVEHSGLAVVSPAHGVAFEGAKDCAIEDNELNDNCGAGIKLDHVNSDLVRRNRCHNNGDDGITLVVSSSNELVLNLCYANGGHGIEVDYSRDNTFNRNDVVRNAQDGFSLEGGSTGNALNNCIMMDNGIGNGYFDLFVADSSDRGLGSDHNLIWNSASDIPVKFKGVKYIHLADYALAANLDHHSIDADPHFVDPVHGNFHLRAGSPAIDAANQDALGWDATGGLDFEHRQPIDDPDSPNLEGWFSDRGAYEYLPGTPTAVGPLGASTLALSAPWPNPTRGAVTLALTLARESDVRWEVLDLAGRRVWSAAPARRPPGATLLRWRPAQRLAPGIYTIRVAAGDASLTRRCVIVK